MRRTLLIGLVLVSSLVLVPTTTTAHATCTATAQKPVRSGSSVFFTGSYNCGTTFHAIQVNVYAQRRAGGSTGAFSTITSVGAFNGNTTQRTAQANLPFACNKDYRTRTTGTATKPGTTSHSSSGVFSAILQNTC